MNTAVAVEFEERADQLSLSDINATLADGYIFKQARRKLLAKGAKFLVATAEAETEGHLRPAPLLEISGHDRECKRLPHDDDCPPNRGARHRGVPDDRLRKPSIDSANNREGCPRNHKKQVPRAGHTAVSP